MKKLLLTFAIITLNLIPSFAKQELEKFSVKVSFAPSFMNGCEIRIDVTNDHGFIRFFSKQYKKSLIDSAFLKRSQLLPLRKFLTDSLKYVDTIKYIKAVDGGDTKMIDMKMGLDGIVIGGHVYYENHDRKFQFWSPGHGTPNALFMAHIFSILNSCFRSAETMNYLEQLEQYFPHRLGIKKLSSSPLRYKLYGSITSDEAEQLDHFFSGLPRHRRIEIDLSNFSGMGTMFYSIIEDYLKLHPNIFWINPNQSALKTLQNIGVSRDKIIDSHTFS